MMHRLEGKINAYPKVADNGIHAFLLHLIYINYADNTYFLGSNRSNMKGLQCKG